MNKIREIISVIRQAWFIHRLEAAQDRLDYLLRVTPRHWSAASVGGQVNLALGKVTHDSALRLARAAGHEIAYVDIRSAFIALKGDPHAANI